MSAATPLHLRVSGSLDRWPIARRIVGWAVLAIALWIVVAQVRLVVRKHHGLPYIRHRILWEKNLYKQAAGNGNPVIAYEVSPFYLLDRALGDVEVLVGPELEKYVWQLEHVSKVRVTRSAIAPVPAEAWQDLAKQATQRGRLAQRKLYLLAGDRSVTTYVLVPTPDDSAAYLVPERVYRAGAARGDNSGANVSAP